MPGSDKSAIKMQPGYEWLWREPAPQMLLELLKLWGTHEVLGPRNNPLIMSWAAETHTTYPGDLTAWCGLGQSIAAKRAGWDFHPNGNALWARNWADWGVKRDGAAVLGDIVVFPRGQGGHVGQYVGEDDPRLLRKGEEACFHILGANQDDAVNIKRHPKNQLAIRHAPWRTGQPDNVRRIFLSPLGAPVSTKES